MQVVRSNKLVRRLPTESNGTPAMDLVFSDIRIRRYTNKIGTEQNTHPYTHTVLLLLLLLYVFFLDAYLYCLVLKLYVFFC